MDDKELVALYLARSETAIEQTEKKYGPLCRSVAMHILGNRQDAEECVNEAYLGAWNTIPPQKPDPFRTYLLRIVRNRSLSRFRSNTTQKRDRDFAVALEELEGILPAPLSVEDEVAGKELSALLDRFLDGLDKKSRVMFLRRYWFGDPVSLIAARFSMRPNAVSVQLLRIRSKLRVFLEKEGYAV